MTRAPTQARHSARPTALALVVLMLLRALVPAGYMPERVGAEGAFEFVICHGGGEPAAAPTATGDERAPGAPRAQSACDYAVLAAAWLPAAPQASVRPPARKAVAVRHAEAGPKLVERARMGGGGARAPPVTT